MNIDSGGRALRVILAVGNPKRERELRDYLTAAGVVIAERCLDGPSIYERAVHLDTDVALVSSDLHRLSPATLSAIRETNLPLVLLCDQSEREQYEGYAYFLSRNAPPTEALKALQEAIQLGVAYGGEQRSESASESAWTESPRGEGRVLALVGGKGSPGVTTVAIGLAHTLAAMNRPVILVDADLRGGDIVPYLDLHPSRGLLGLAASRYGAGLSVEDELQDGPGFRALAGLERPEDYAAVTPELMAATLAELRELRADVLVDLGQVSATTPSPVSEAVLRHSDGVLLVSRADLVGAWHTRCCLHYLANGLGIPEGGVALVVNFQQGRGQFSPGELASTLSVELLGVILDDRKSALNTAQAQLPISAAGGKMSTAFRGLAAGLTGQRAGSTRATPAKRSWRPRLKTVAGRR